MEPAIKYKYDMDKGLLTKIQSVVVSFDRKEFTSHGFIKKFLERYEDDYRNIFAAKTLQATHAQLARLLSENAKTLGITKKERTESENFHGKKSIVQKWKFLVVCLVCSTWMSMNASAQTFSPVQNPESNNQTMCQMLSAIRDKDYSPQNLMVKGNISVVDTLKAQELCKNILNRNEDKLFRLTILLSSKDKIIKDEADLFLMNEAFVWVKNFRPDLLKKGKININSMSLGGILIEGLKGGLVQTKDITSKIEESIQNGRLTGHTKEILRTYQEYLTYKFSSDKWEEIVTPLPMKTIDINVFNPYYRGFNFYDNDLLDLVETEQQRTWNFLYSSDYEKKEDSYPQELEYLSFDGYPQYKVTYDEDTYAHEVRPKFVYDANGNLVYVASLTRKYDNSPFREVERLVYLRDYQNNKYGIKSQSEKTQNYLRLYLCRGNGFERTQGEAVASALVAALASDLRYTGNAGERIADETLTSAGVYIDSDGKNYISQLEKDHSSEFGSVYMIERVSNMSFRIVYLGTKLRPSHCAIITYKTGDKPFTQELSGCLVSMPDNLPPIIKCSGAVYKNVKKIGQPSFSEMSDKN